jgi:hypothetical protein
MTAAAISFGRREFVFGAFMSGSFAKSISCSVVMSNGEVRNRHGREVDCEVFRELSDRNKGAWQCSTRAAEVCNFMIRRGFTLSRVVLADVSRTSMILGERE